MAHRNPTSPPIVLGLAADIFDLHVVERLGEIEMHVDVDVPLPRDRKNAVNLSARIAVHIGHRADHPSAVVRLTNLAMVLKDLGQPAEARPLLQRALLILERTYGPDHPIVATSLTNLALVLKDLGQTAEARPLLTRAHRIAERTLPPNHPTRAKIAAHLAQTVPPPAPSRPGGLVA